MPKKVIQWFAPKLSASIQWKSGHIEEWVHPRQCVRVIVMYNVQFSTHLCCACLLWPYQQILVINSFWPNRAIWRHRSGSTLLRKRRHQTMTWINVGCTLVGFCGNFTACAQATILNNEFYDDPFKITVTYTREQWLNVTIYCNYSRVSIVSSDCFHAKSFHSN